MQKAETILRINIASTLKRRDADSGRQCQHIKAMLLEVQLTHQHYFFSPQ